MKKVICGVEVEVVDLFEGLEGEVGLLVRKVGENVGIFWIVRRKDLKRKIVKEVARRSMWRAF